MYLSPLNILLFVAGSIYLIILPGYVVLHALRIKGLDLVETFTIVFGLGIIVMTSESIILSVQGSIGLTVYNLVILTAVFIVIAELAPLVKERATRI